MRPELAARWFVFGLLLGLPLAVFGARWTQTARVQEIHAQVAEAGGWTPDHFIVGVGEPLRLSLTSEDVWHGFAIGQSDRPAVDVPPGQVVETTLSFTQPGRYTFYCTRWCGPNHWRMRGTIEVIGDSATPVTETAPLYVQLNLDIDALHPAQVIPAQKPSAIHRQAFITEMPEQYRTLAYYRAHSPADVWQALRAEATLNHRSDAELWDGVAALWQAQTTPAQLAESRKLYSQNCAACHGEHGAGDGVYSSLARVANLTDAASMLGASPALLQGKIIRGGMGTGMPYWGPIFTEAQTWVLVSYLYLFQFKEQP